MAAELGPRLTDGDEILFRQVHPLFLQGGRISSQAFEATSVHDGLLSVDRESLTSAQAAFELYTGGFGGSSAGVCGVTVAEVDEERVGVFSDPLPAEQSRPANPAHVVVDMRRLGRVQIKRIASRLAQKARERGLLYHP